jgi:lambda family phage tail tape measure protein
MASENIDIVVTETGSVVVKRNLDDMGNSAQATQDSIKLLTTALANSGDAMSAISGNTDKIVQSLQQLNDTQSKMLTALRSGGQAMTDSATATDTATVAVKALSETEDQALARIKAAIAASREEADARDALAEATRNATTANDQMTKSQSSIPSKTATEMGIPFTSASAVDSKAQEAAAAEAEKVVAALQREIDIMGLTRGEIEKYDAAAAGFSAAEQAKVMALGKTIDAMKLQEAEAKAMAKAEDDSAAAANNFIASLKAQAAAIGQTKDQQLTLKAAELGVSEQAAGYIAQLKAGTEAHHAFSLATAGSQRELMVMFGELARGDVRRFATSFGVFARQTGLLQMALSPIGGAVAAVTAAFAVVTIAILEGEGQLTKFNKAMQATGGFAGITQTQVTQFASSLDAMGVRVTQANTTLNTVIATGKFTGDTILSVAAAASLLGDATGENASKVVTEFTRMSDKVAEGAAKMNEQYHFLTLAQYDEIKALEDHGNKMAATKETADILTQALLDQKPVLGTLPQLWKDLGDAAATAWQKMMNLGKPSGPADELKKLQDQLALTLDEQKNAPSWGADPKQWDSAIQGIQDKMKNYQAFDDNEKKLAQQTAARKQQQEDAIASAQAVDKLSASLDKNYEKTSKLAALNVDFQKLWNNPDDASHSNKRLQGVTQNADGSFQGGEYDKLQAALNKKYDPKVKKASTAVDTAQLQFDTDAVKQALNGINDAYTNNTRALDTAHKLGTISDTEYYDTQRQQIATHANDQMAQMQREVDILNAHKSSGAEAIRVNKQIQDVEQQMAKVRDDTATKFQNSVIQEVAAQDKRIDATNKFRDALQNQIDTQQNAVDIQVASVGQGTLESQQAQQLNALQRQYDKQRTTLVGQMTQAKSPDDKAMYEKQLQDLQAASDQAVSITTTGFAQMKAAQADWTNGAKSAFQNYSDGAANIAGQVNTAFTNGFTSMENSLVSFVTTGKLSFSSFATGVITDLARIAVKMAESAALKEVFSAFSIGAGIPGFAEGGYTGDAATNAVSGVVHGKEYVVNAAATAQPGVRAMLDALNSGGALPSGGAAVAPGTGSSGGSSAAPIVVQLYTNVDANGNATTSAASATSNKDANDLANRVQALVVKELVQQQQPNGILWNVAQGQAR